MSRWLARDDEGRIVDVETVEVTAESSAAFEVGTGAAVPTGAPSGLPFYLRTNDNSLYVWDGSAWQKVGLT
jgi:hypothetical protein